VMILGIGSDLVSLERIERMAQQYGQRFYDRILTNDEQHFLQKLDPKSQTPYIAKRFAGKEAVSKALGTGFSEGLSFKDIEILNYKNGRPKVCLHGTAIDILNRLSDGAKKTDIAITLTDEPPYAQAMVIISTVS